MNKRKLVTSILAGALALLMIGTLLFSIVPPAVVVAEKSATQVQGEINALEQEKAELDKQMAELQAKYDENMSEIEKLVEEKRVIDQEITLLHDKMATINEQIAVYSTQIAEKQAELDTAIANLETLRAENKERIRAMEENGTLSYWEVVFQASDFSDLLDRLNMIEEIERGDQQRLEEMRVAAEAVETAKKELEEEKAALEVVRAELEETGKVLSEKQAQTDALLQELLAKGAEYDKYIEEQEAMMAELEAQIDEKQGILDEIEKAEYEKWLASQKPANGNGSQTGSTNVGGNSWIVPINYTWFSSAYGWRIHPIYGNQRFHNGVDLSAPSGTPIYAARSGVVYYRGWWGTGGNTIMINHQDGYKTRYLHMSSFAVANGEWVAQGQVIGYCGSTGDSTGPHLHFEILYNDSRVNPADYMYLK